MTDVTAKLAALKKRLALNSKLLGNQKELDNHIEKVNAVNLRYKVIRDKKAEMPAEASDIKEDSKGEKGNKKIRLYLLRKI